MSKPQKKTPPTDMVTEQPLFFRNPVPVDSTRHKDAGLSRKTGLQFSKNTNSVPVTAHEFIELARSFPIVFTIEPTPMPLAILGLKQQNCFVNHKGDWLEGHYIPTYIRKYPFALLELPEEQKFALCLDEDSDHYQVKKPDVALFDGAKPSPMAQQAMDLCSLFHSQHQQTIELGKMLKAYDLLEQKDMKALLDNGENVQIGGFQMISEDRWNALSDRDVASWRKKQWLGLIYLVLASQVNWKYLAALEIR